LLVYHSTIFFLLILLPPKSTLFPYTTLFRSQPELLLQCSGHDHSKSGKSGSEAELITCAIVRVNTHQTKRKPVMAIGFVQGNHQIGRATSELQSRGHLVCRLLLEKKKKKHKK